MNEEVREGRDSKDSLLSITLNTQIFHSTASHPPTKSCSRAPALPCASQHISGVTLQSRISIGISKNSRRSFLFPTWRAVGAYNALTDLEVKAGCGVRRAARWVKSFSGPPNIVLWLQAYSMASELRVERDGRIHSLIHPLTSLKQWSTYCAQSSSMFCRGHAYK